MSYPWSVPTVVMSEEYIGLRWTGQFLVWWGWGGGGSGGGGGGEKCKISCHLTSIHDTARQHNKPT